MNPGDRELLADFDRCRGVTLDLLNRVPEKLLKKKPRGEDISLGLLFHHIAVTVDGWLGNCMKDGGMTPVWDPPKTPPKQEIIQSLESSRRRLLKFFKAKGGTAMSRTYKPQRNGKTYRFTGRNRVAYLTAHEGHHRGKMVLALRQMGFTDIPFLPFPHQPV